MTLKLLPLLLIMGSLRLHALSITLGIDPSSTTNSTHGTITFSGGTGAAEASISAANVFFDIHSFNDHNTTEGGVDFEIDTIMGRSAFNADLNGTSHNVIPGVPIAFGQNACFTKSFLSSAGTGTVSFLYGYDWAIYWDGQAFSGGGTWSAIEVNKPARSVPDDGSTLLLCGGTVGIVLIFSRKMRFDPAQKQDVTR